MSSTSTDIVVEHDLRLQEPRKHKVIMHNDDKTTFDFVIVVLQTVFYKSLQESAELAAHIDMSGAAIVGTYTKEVAAEKVAESISFARLNNFPLMVTHEEI